MTASRLNARIDARTAKKLALLQRRTGLTTSEIVRAAIEHYSVEGARSDAGREVWEAIGFVGCASGPADLASSYKLRQTDSLAKKTG
jgi:hypothetical protein